MDRMKQDALTKERMNLAYSVKAILDKADREKRNLTGGEVAMINAADARSDEIRNLLGQNGRPEFGESRGRYSTPMIDAVESAEGDAALRAWALGPKGARPEHVAAAERMGIPWMSAQLDLRALSIGTTTAGGNAVANEVVRSFTEIAKWYGRVESVATTIATDTGAVLPWPTVDDTANTGRLLTEGTGATTTTDPSFGVVNLSAYKMSSDAVIVSEELLQDSAIPIATYLGTALGTRVGRIKNTYFTTGTGSSQPAGVQVKASLGKTASATNAITFDEVIDLYHAVDPAYRNSPKCAFMMHDTVAAYVRKLKDSQNRYLWEMSTQVGMPDRILGVPVVINNDMDSAFSTNKRLVLFGDFSKYIVRTAGGIVLRRSDDVYFLNHQSVFEGSQRVDGNLVDTSAVRYLRTA